MHVPPLHSLPYQIVGPLPVPRKFPLSVRFPLMVWLAENVFETLSCGTLVVSRLTVTLPLEPPPVRSVPAVMPVIVPVAGLTQLQALLTYARIWPLEQAVVSERFSVPVLPPPWSPLPVVVLMPVMVPPPPPTPLATIQSLDCSQTTGLSQR